MFALFAEIMGKDINFKRLRAQVGGHRDLAANFQTTKRKKGGASSFADTTSAQGAPAGAASGQTPSADANPTGSVPHKATPTVTTSPMVTASGFAPTDVTPEVINLDGSSKGGTSLPSPNTIQPRGTAIIALVADLTATTKPSTSGYSS